MQSDRLTTSLQHAYGFSTLAWKSQLGGFSSKNIAFEADGIAYVLKQYGANARAQIGRLEAIATCLQQCDFPAPVPLRNRAGKRHFFCEGNAFAVFARVEGKVLHQASLSGVALESTASLLNRLHRLGETAAYCLTPRVRAQQSGRLEKMLKAVLQADERTSPWLRMVQESFRLKKRLQAQHTRQKLQNWPAGRDFVHGDFHNENVLYDESRKACCVLDYEESYLGHGICDAINFVQFACCNNGFDAAGLSASRYFIASYTKLRPCPPAEIHLGWLSFFERMAMSTFLEERLLTGDASFAGLVQRDIGKMTAQLQEGIALSEAILP